MIGEAVALVIIVKLLLLRLSNMEISIMGYNNKQISVGLLVVLTWILLISPMTMMPKGIRIIFGSLLLLGFILPKMKGVQENGNRL